MELEHSKRRGEEMNIVYYIASSIIFGAWTESLLGGLFWFSMILTLQGLMDHLGDTIRRL